MAKRSSTKRHRAPTRTEKSNKASVEANGSDRQQVRGKLASEVEMRHPKWLLYPWIPHALLSMVVGHPCVGKSSFIAALIAHATGGANMEDIVRGPSGRVVFLPGHEEDLEVMTIPRLKAARVRLERVKLLTEEGISVLRDKERLARTVNEFGAILLVGDPIDSYIDEGFAENDGQAVRPLLEAAAWIARETQAAVCFARHPGKDPENVMPGSRAWRAVPRSIVQLTADGQIPPDFQISHFKDSLGTKSTPRRYVMEQKGEGAPRFLLGNDLDATTEELTRAALGPLSRYKLMTACRLVRWTFTEESAPTRAKLGEEARKLGLGEDTLADALRLLGVRSVPPAHRGDPWKLVHEAGEWPAWLPDESIPL